MKKLEDYIPLSLFQDIVDSNGDLQDLEMEFRAYSGRGMMGEECLGVVVGSHNDLNNFILGFALEAVTMLTGGDLSLEELEKVKEGLRILANPRSDSMGLSAILYWPNRLSADSEYVGEVYGG